MRLPALVLLALLFSVPCRADAPVPKAGSFGFDWLQPRSARCIEITAALMESFRSCESRPDGTFGLRDPALACRKARRSEFVIYPTRAVCQRNLETMQANAP